MTLESLQRRHGRVSSGRIGVAKQCRMLGGQCQLRVEEQPGIEASGIHGRGRCRIVQQSEMRRRIQSVRIEVRQQMRRRVNRWSH